MLAVASYPANEIAEMSYTFWYRLSRNLTASFHDSDQGPSLQVRTLPIRCMSKAVAMQNQSCHSRHHV